jgi:hypothetical protein
MVEQQPSKLNTRVRFPSPAPFLLEKLDFAKAQPLAPVGCARWALFRIVNNGGFAGAGTNLARLKIDSP